MYENSIYSSNTVTLNLMTAYPVGEGMEEQRAQDKLCGNILTDVLY